MVERCWVAPTASKLVTLIWPSPSMHCRASPTSRLAHGSRLALEASPATVAGEMGLLAAALAATGSGSFAFHGPQPSWAKVAHGAPMFAVVALAVGNEAIRLLPVVEGLDSPRPSQAHRVAVVAGAAALGAYGLGRTGSPVCRPESRLQWHAVWHVLSSIAVAAVAAARIESS